MGEGGLRAGVHMKCQGVGEAGYACCSLEPRVVR